MESELHIAGIVVFSNPSCSAEVAACIRAIPSATIFVVAADGKIIVTLEADSSRRTLAYMDAIRVLPGVINVAMVYQHAEPLSELEEEIE